MHGTATRLWRGSGPVLAVALFALPAAAADTPQCRIECAATFAEREQNTTLIQACLARCAIRSAALGAANVTGTTAMPTPQTPWTVLPNGRRPSQALVEAERQAQAQRAALRQPARGRRLSPPQSPQPVAAPVSGNAPSSAPGASFFGSLLAAQAAVPGAAASAPTPSSPAPRVSYGAIYLAASPSRAYGLAVGSGDRIAAHRVAESACKAASTNTCRSAGEFTARCGAVAHALRSNNAVIMTASPSTYTVAAATSGSGATREEAERQAMAACEQRGRGLTCQVTEARCAN